MGIVGKKQSVALDHFRNIPGHPGLGQTLFPEVLGGNAGELFDFRRHEAAGAQGDELVIFLNDLGNTVYPFHHHRGEFDDLVPGKEQSRGFRVE